MFSNTKPRPTLKSAARLFASAGFKRWACFNIFLFHQKCCKTLKHRISLEIKLSGLCSFCLRFLSILTCQYWELSVSLWCNFCLIATPDEDLLGINNQLPVSGIINLDKMAEYIDEITCSRIIKFSNYDRSAIYIKDEELQLIDQIIDDTIINNLLSNDSYSPSMRKIFPSHLFRAELLKALKYPEISYRDFCDDEYLGLDRQQNRVFIGLPLHKNTTIDHTQLSRFRTNMTFKQQINLLIYFLHHFYKSDLLGGCTLCAVDSTELANDCKVPLAIMTIKGKKIRIYGDLDCDCGTRRNKRDKSIYIVGYRLHTLTVIDVQSRQSFPLVSILAPANHHDSKFLPFLVKLAQAMGIDVNLITARVKELTDRRRTPVPLPLLVKEVNQVVRGWSAYFHCGNSTKVLGQVKWFTEERVRKHLRTRYKVRTRTGGYNRFSSDFLYRQLGLYKIPTNAKWKIAHALQ